MYLLEKQNGYRDLFFTRIYTREKIVITRLVLIVLLACDHRTGYVRSVKENIILQVYKEIYHLEKYLWYVRKTLICRFLHSCLSIVIYSCRNS